MRNPNSDKANYRHGLCGTPIYKAWYNMLTRCYNKNGKDYRYYGARGIKVCESLRSSVVNLHMLIGDPPECYSLNRVDNNGNYSCGTCAECQSNEWTMNIEWTAHTNQMRNTRYNRLLTLNGHTRCIKEWSEILGILPDTIRARLNYGYSDEDALYAGRFSNKGKRV